MKINRGKDLFLLYLRKVTKSRSIRTGVCISLLGVSLALNAVADTTVPEPFQRFDPASKNTINYKVLTGWLKTVVMDIGLSDRSSARNEAGIGTRIAPKITNRSSFEGNRVFFENFVGNEKVQTVLKGIRESRADSERTTH